MKSQYKNAGHSLKLAVLYSKFFFGVKILKGINLCTLKIGGFDGEKMIGLGVVVEYMWDERYNFIDT